MDQYLTLCGGGGGGGGGLPSSISIWKINTEGSSQMNKM